MRVSNILNFLIPKHKITITSENSDEKKQDKKLKIDTIATTASSMAVLSKADSFTIPDSGKIQEYIKAFSDVLNNLDINKIFKIVNFINQPSSNGSIYVVQLKKSVSKFSKLLIKVPKTPTADPVSYEYYVGLTLNNLRPMNIQNFGLVYGRFFCGFNPSDPKNNSELLSRKLCDNKYKKKTHVLYEYITTLSDKTITLYKYINDENNNDAKKNINLINILIMLMISLQNAQDELNFTHYDLHLENVLLVKLNATYNFVYEYKGKKYNILLEYFPFIIDYGRSHVNPDKVDKSLEIYDYDNQISYEDFKEYQNLIWKDANFVLDPENNPKDKKLQDRIKALISSKLENLRFKKTVQKILQKDRNIRLYVEEITVDTILELFYHDKNNRITYNIHPEKYHKSYDHFKLTQYMCSEILRNDDDDTKIEWRVLQKELQFNYPFYIPGIYSLPSEYSSFNGDFNSPIDIANYLYMDVEKSQKNDIDVKEKLDFTQIGSGKINKEYEKIKVEKLSNIEAANIYKKLNRKIKNKRN
jgi:hypothetical protein